jgi:hypothetical protein
MGINFEDGNLKLEGGTPDFEDGNGKTRHFAAVSLKMGLKS